MSAFNGGGGRTVLLVLFYSPILQTMQTLGILKNSQDIPGHQMSILRTFDLTRVSTEITNRLESMQNP